MGMPKIPHKRKRDFDIPEEGAGWPNFIPLPNLKSKDFDSEKTDFFF